VRKKFKFDKETPILVLKQPLWTTRFGLEEEWLGGYEIYNGAGRASTLYALEKETAKVMICKDKHPGTGNKGKFEDKLKGISGVWK
jgi:hypothetical protein